jgi:hypothetical protein
MRLALALWTVAGSRAAAFPAPQVQAAILHGTPVALAVFT